MCHHSFTCSTFMAYECLIVDHECNEVHPQRLYTHKPQCRCDCTLPVDEYGCGGTVSLVGSLELQVSFAEYRLFYRALLQMWPGILKMNNPQSWHMNDSWLTMTHSRVPHMIHIHDTWMPHCGSWMPFRMSDTSIRCLSRRVCSFCNNGTYQSTVDVHSLWQ